MFLLHMFYIVLLCIVCRLPVAGRAEARRRGVERGGRLPRVRVRARRGRLPPRALRLRRRRQPHRRRESNYHHHNSIVHGPLDPVLVRFQQDAETTWLRLRERNGCGWRRTGLYVKRVFVIEG